ncbi:MAG: DUF3127 domain-containing protein [Chitinophagales bacterium]|nr:DUF3127 domain-containing protein [Chitinophagales bacterium]
MPLDLIGKLITMLPEQTGQGQNGNWFKQSFVLETQDQYPKKICFTAWNDKAEFLKLLKTGDEVKVAFNLESREYNGRWYTDAKVWRIEKMSGGEQSTRSEYALNTEPPQEDVSQFRDDLPF